MERLVQDAVRVARAGAWEYVRADDQTVEKRWRFRATPELRALIGLRDSEIDQTPAQWLAFVEPEDAAHFQEAILQCLRGFADRLDVVFRIRSRSGRTMTLRSAGHLERGPDGRTRRLLGLTWDITDYDTGRKREAVIARAFDTAAEAMVICNAAGTIVDANPAFLRLGGWSVSTIQGESFGAVVFGPDAADASAVWAGVRGKGRWAGPIQLQRQDGSVLAARLSVAAVHSSDGSLTHYSALILEADAMSSTGARAADATAPSPLPGIVEVQRELALAIKEAVGVRAGLAVFILSIDRLLSLIETLGRSRVDRLLEDCQQQLQRAIDSVVVVSRVHGDRFAIVAADVIEERDVEQAFARFRGALRTDVVLNGKPFPLSATAGVAVFPLDGVSAEVLLQRAESALEEAGRRSRSGGQLEMYKPQLSDHASDLVHIEANLRKALKLGTFECHLQPKVRLEDGRWVGAEALLRWRLGDTWIAPSRFIPIAEESGLMKDMGRWVLWEAASKTAQWLKAGLIDDTFRVAVNLAGAQLETELVRTVRAVLGYTQLPSSALMLELTENIIVTDPRRARSLLEDLHQIGVHIALDDFGTGHTSMGQLRTLPVNELKIDQSFVRGLPDEPGSLAIVRSVLTLAQGLQLDVVAEGIETEAQRASLMKLGCRFGQGFLFAKALPPEEFEARLRTARLQERGAEPARLQQQTDRQ